MKIAYAIPWVECYSLDFPCEEDRVHKLPMNKTLKDWNPHENGGAEQSCIWAGLSWSEPQLCGSLTYFMPWYHICAIHPLGTRLYDSWNEKWETYYSRGYLRNRCLTRQIFAMQVSSTHILWCMCDNCIYKRVESVHKLKPTHDFLVGRVFGGMQGNCATHDSIVRIMGKWVLCLPFRNRFRHFGVDIYVTL